MVDIADLRAFLAVAEELHFGRAAERLHIAQPPLSRMIKQLERELGTVLFERTTRSVRLTASGQALIAPAQAVLDALRRAQDVVASADGGEVGLVRIAFAGLSTHRLVARLAREIRSQRPGIELELSSQNFAQPAMKKLVQEQTDIALGRWDVLPPEVSAQIVMPDTLVLALPDTHRRAGSRHASLAEFAEDGFVSLPSHEGAVLPDRLRRMAQVHNFVPNVVQVAPDTQTALALVAAEVGAHLTLESVARNATDPHIVFVTLDDATPDVSLRAAWRTADPSPALRAVLDILLGLDAVT